jgi:hypothetical protein
MQDYPLVEYNNSHQFDLTEVLITTGLQLFDQTLRAL